MFISEVRRWPTPTARDWFNIFRFAYVGEVVNPGFAQDVLRASISNTEACQAQLVNMGDILPVPPTPAGRTAAAAYDVAAAGLTLKAIANADVGTGRKTLAYGMFAGGIVASVAGYTPPSVFAGPFFEATTLVAVNTLIGESANPLRGCFP